MYAASEINYPAPKKLNQEISKNSKYIQTSFRQLISLQPKNIFTFPKPHCPNFPFPKLHYIGKTV